VVYADTALLRVWSVALGTSDVTGAAVDTAVIPFPKHLAEALLASQIPHGMLNTVHAIPIGRARTFNTPPVALTLVVVTRIPGPPVITRASRAEVPAGMWDTRVTVRVRWSNTPLTLRVALPTEVLTRLS
jgi:hypothetical protein